MAYTVIARRWRPQQFDDIIGQDHVSRTLSNAIKNNRIAHSYIFTGPRGVGKTTTARIMAKALNCETGPTPAPCGSCSSCVSITEGNSLDVLEIDGASNRGIDEIRNLRENIRYTPSQGKYRIYIIDEVHMLTKEAFNALLKTLEEPPEHVIFIFATTEIHRVPATILSRCQRFDFRRLPLRTIMDHLQHICDGDKVEIEQDALLQIAKKADGSMRDSQSILDQIISYSGTKIGLDDVLKSLGVIHQDLFFKTAKHIFEQDVKELILLAAEVFASGYDLNEFLLGLEDHFRNILVLKAAKLPEYLDVSENYIQQYQESAELFSENDLIAYLHSIAETEKDVKLSQQPNMKFELGLIKLAKMPRAVQIESLLEKIDLLKKKSPLNQAAEPPDTEYSVNTNTEKKISLQDIKDKWSDILAKLLDEKPTLTPVIERGELQSFNAGQLELFFKKVNPFEKDLAEKNLNFLNNFISSGLNFDIDVLLKFEIIEQNNQVKKTEKNVNKEELMSKIRQEGGDVISSLIDDMDLELI